MRTLSRRGHLVCAVLLGLVLTACEGRRRPSVLIVASDSLPLNLSLCTKESLPEEAGFRRLCEESIRFTHVVTPSVLTVPALTSLMTGLVPAEHAVRHNGSPGLSPSFRTFAEVAAANGRHTAFFSGGAPVWRRTGLHQGFEIFDDNIPLANGRLFRSLSENTHLFFQWLSADVGGAPFAAVVYVPDLAFTDTVTESAQGELRPLNYDSQLEEFDESLNELFERLRRLDRWNDTMIVVVGLNGREVGPRPGEIEPLILNSENTQVSLFIKPVMKPRDQAIHWKIDRNVGLADVGYTLLKFLGDTAVDEPRAFPAASLLTALTSAQPDWDEDRSLPIESGWAVWQGWGGLRTGLVVGHDLIRFDRPPVMFNTLVDRFETTPIPLDESSRARLQTWRELGAGEWTPPTAAQRAIFRISSIDWLSPARAPALHRQLMEISSEKNADDRVLRWAAQSALEQRDWAQLARLGKKAKKSVWTDVAERNLGKNARLEDPCLSLLGPKPPDSNRLKRCTDETFLSLFAWARADLKGDSSRESARRRFLRAWEAQQMDMRILKTNAGLGLLWLPATAEEGLPSTTTLALALPELRRFAGGVSR